MGACCRNIEIALHLTILIYIYIYIYIDLCLFKDMVTKTLVHRLINRARCDTYSKIRILGLSLLDVSRFVHVDTSNDLMCRKRRFRP